MRGVRRVRVPPMGRRRGVRRCPGRSSVGAGHRRRTVLGVDVGVGVRGSVRRRRAVSAPVRTASGLLPGWRARCRTPRRTTRPGPSSRLRRSRPWRAEARGRQRLSGGCRPRARSLRPSARRGRPPRRGRAEPTAPRVGRRAPSPVSRSRARGGRRSRTLRCSSTQPGARIRQRHPARRHGLTRDQLAFR